MKIGVFTVVLGDRNLNDACAYLTQKGVQMVEIGCGGYPGTAHCDPVLLLQDEQGLEEFQNTLSRHKLGISALSCHCNPIHPNQQIARQMDRELDNAILLCEKLGIGILNTFSGCPGDSAASTRPNWVTCPWPEDFTEILDYQWNEVLIPYWKEKVKFARQHGVDKIAIEMHPGFCVYNTRTLLRLRDAVGPEIGANFDPSHLIWQGMDPVLCIRELGKHNALFHFHAKDTKVDAYNTAMNGVLDTTHYADEINRSWIFRSVGYGSGYEFWRNIVSELRLAGYDHVLSIEHEDSLMSGNEGLTKAIQCLKDVLFFEEKGGMFWA